MALTSLAGESTETRRSARSVSMQSYAPWSPLATKTLIPADAAAAIELAMRDSALGRSGPPRTNPS